MVCHYGLGGSSEASECRQSANLALVRNTIDTPYSGMQPTVFGPYVCAEEPYGVCQVCHINGDEGDDGATEYYRNDGSGWDHPDYTIDEYTGGGPGSDCTLCHRHVGEFHHGGGRPCEACHGHDAGYVYDEEQDPSQGAGSVESHSVHTEGDGEDLKGPHKDCDSCHDTQNYPRFKYDPLQDDDSDGEIDLAETEVCDPCHSPGGAINGVTMAKPNWDTGVYDSQYQHLPDWQANTEYETGDIVLYGDPAGMYVAKSTFPSGASFLPDNWKQIQNIDWVLWGGCETGDLFRNGDQVYRSQIEHTMPVEELDPENWELVERTGAGKEVLQEGKEQWCASCHDDQPANSKAGGTGTDAPNVLGDGSTYGFYVSGHGRPGINQNCLDCHNSTFVHIDHEHRTYETHLTEFEHVEHAYKDSYRLKEAMRIPMHKRSDETVGEAMADGYDLCMKTCHEPHAGVLSEPKYGETDFREEEEGAKPQYHTSYHLVRVTAHEWDSDWDGTKADSGISCPACHNVHGSPMMVNGYLKPNPVMTRHGELISTPGAQDKVPGLDLRWFDDYEDPRYCGDNETNVLEDSRGGHMCNTGHLLSETHVCNTCHGTDGYHRFPGGAPQILGGEYGSEIIIWTTDTDPDNTVKTAFYPGEGIRYHVSFYLTGADNGTEYCIQALDSKAHNDGTMPGADWTDPIDIDTLLPRGPYEMHWDRTIPLDAEEGPAQYRMELQMFDFDCAPPAYNSVARTHDFTVAVQETTAPPVRPTLTPQPNIPDLVSASVTLEWSTVLCPDGDPVQYRVEVDDSSDFATPEHTLSWQSGTSWQTPDLATGTTWYWRVQARDEVHTDRESDWSYPDAFDIFAPLDAPATLTHDLNATDPVPVCVDLEWSAVTCPDGHGIEYFAEIGDASDFSGNTYHSGWQSATKWGIMLPTAGTWYWRVKTRDAHVDHIDHESAWSTTDSFVIEATPSTPTLIPVADDDSPGPVEVTLAWIDDVTCPTGNPLEYMVQVSDCVDFDDSPCIQHTSGWQPDIGWNVTLDTDGTWYWRAQAKDTVTGYLSAWSATDAFVVSPCILGESFEGPGYEEETWTETVGFNCTLDEDHTPIPGTGPPEAGSECLRAVSGISGYQAKAERDCGTPHPITYTTFYFLVEAEGLLYDQRKSIGYMTDNAGGHAWGFGLYQDSTQLKFNVYLYNNGTWIQGFYDISLNTWYKVDVKYDTVSDTWALQLNGTSVGSGSLGGTHRENIQTWAFGLTDPTQYSTATVYFDKITVRDEWLE